ncbi:MAG TPA: ribonuclease III domain-containing protein, partial [Candidatus Acidoferrales bacterium]|nr:ribonuclease III domain-containing protein [Candidatus Acidoferrales bacterium]
MEADDRQSLERLLGYRLQNEKLLERALTHSSWAAENAAKSADGDAEDNERLEFLGDAVLALVVSEWLTRAFPLWREGQLSKARASLVNAGTLGEAARALGLGAFLRLGRGEEKTGGREKPALLANAYEAVIGALFLDGGLSP